MQHVYQVAVGPGDGFLFEIITEAPVAEHLKHGVVVRVAAHLLQVVVFARHAQAFLRVALAAALGFGIAQDDVLKLVHTGIGKHQGGVVLDDHRSRGYYQVALLLEKSLERFAYFVGCHCIGDVFNFGREVTKNLQTKAT